MTAAPIPNDDHHRPHGGDVTGLREAEREALAAVIAAHRQCYRESRVADILRFDCGVEVPLNSPSPEAAHLADAILAARAAQTDATTVPLRPEVERGVECYHGSPRACESYRCGSNCSQRFDRMHPCPACLIAKIHDLRAAVESLGLDPFNMPAALTSEPQPPGDTC